MKKHHTGKEEKLLEYKRKIKEEEDKIITLYKKLELGFDIEVIREINLSRGKIDGWRDEIKGYRRTETYGSISIR